MYQALPKCLHIKDSPVAGQGIYAKEDIPDNIYLGISHVVVDDEIMRTPLGGFVNHSDKPNCEKVQLKSTNYTKYNLVAIKNIKAWEELTVKYTFYNMTTPITAPMMDLE